MFSKARLFAPLCLALGTSMSANAAVYCLAIRGNGELEPAHWGAVANIVERLGLPKMQAGGSSASITMLLTDAIATNQLVKATVQNGIDKAQGERAALLLKSLHGLLIEIKKTKQFKEVKALFAQAQELRDPQWADNLKKMLVGAAQTNPLAARAEVMAKMELVSEAIRIGRELGLLNVMGYQPLFEALERMSTKQQDDQSLTRDLKITAFYSTELLEALKNFGSFNADSGNLFFRPGIVNFDKLAMQFGRIADLYSMKNLAMGEESMWRGFMSTCAKAARGKTWEELISAKPDCQTQFGEIVRTHFENSQGNFATNPIGVTIPSFPITSVLTGNARDEFMTAKAAYELAYLQGPNPDFAANFVLNHPEEVRFGYFGSDDLLARIDAKLVRDNEKSRRFLALGHANWSVALGLSPAEPGLSSLKPFTAPNGEQMVSAGGWPDLEPMQVLRAAGCENVVFATRRGGPSKFGVRIAERLLGKAPIDSLYNLENENSSIKKSLKQADAILCTSWDADRFKIQNGVSGMINDAYTSPFHVNSNGGLARENLSPLFDAATDDGTFKGCH